MSIITQGYGTQQLIITQGYGTGLIVVVVEAFADTILYLNLLNQTQTFGLLNSHLQSDLYRSGSPLGILKNRVLTTTLQQKRILKTVGEEGVLHWP